jgi:hypothetical protein
LANTAAKSRTWSWSEELRVEPDICGLNARNQPSNG